MHADMQAVLSGHADETILINFRGAWREWVHHILEDGGESTVSQIG